ncbi:hypothetical protein M9458_016567, partial [Cirrhinus mrigala]
VPQFCSSLYLTDFIQEIQSVQENTASTGSDIHQDILIQELFTLMITGVINAWRDQRTAPLPRAVSTVFLRLNSDHLMLGFITVL